MRSNGDGGGATTETAWLCATALDVDGDEREAGRSSVLPPVLPSRSVFFPRAYKGRREESQLDKDLTRYTLERRRKAAQRSLIVASSSSGSNNDSHASAPLKTKKPKGAIYALENLRLAMLMRDPALRGRVKKKRRRPRLMDDMLTLEKQFAQAALRIQRWWRTHLRRVFWKSYLHQVRAAVVLQRYTRGFLCRALLRVWHANRSYRVTRIQAAFRGYVMRIVIQSWKVWEYSNIVRIQAIVRSYFARKRWRRQQRAVAALHIQMLWRGYVSRRHTDRLWLAQKAVNLQRLIRGVLVRRTYKRQPVLYQQAVIQIQRMFRGTHARSVVDAILCDRETANRQEWMLVLETEEEWFRIQRDKLQARLERFQLQQQVLALEEEDYRKHERIHDMESIYLDMQTQRMRVSPRAIEHGWVEEMEAKMKIQRKLITQMKLDVVFGSGLALKQKEVDLAQLQAKIQATEETRQKFETWREEEFLDYWERECYFKHEALKAQKRRRIADQKRRWRIKLYHTSGKPDTRWKGSHWCDEVLEDAKRREVFCIGNANTLAVIQEKWQARMTGSTRAIDDQAQTQAHVDSLVSQVELVAATAQMQQTQAIFDPVFMEVEQTVLLVQEKERRRMVKIREKREAQRQQQQSPIHRDEGPVVSPPHDDRAIATREVRLAKLPSAKIPWHLLDQLASERQQLAEEKALFKTWGKSHKSYRASNPGCPSV